MSLTQKLRNLILGAPRNPLSPDTHKHLALIAFLAWVGLGADGLSSSCYGPEEAFIALGVHNHFGVYLAIATAATVFLIAFSYNQVIELFPTGGGGYKVATHLISPVAGLVSGSALIVDYVLTISISTASGVNSLFSLLPVRFQGAKLDVELAAVCLLIVLNLRGMKESVRILLPLFLGFFITHVFLILYGILMHANNLPSLLPDTVKDTVSLSQEIGWFAALSLFLKAYSLGGGTYTGLEAVSNNVNMLAEPRVKTGKLTMLYMAASLSFVAGGIILLYLLWGAHRVEGQTLNAVVFSSILDGWQGKQLILTVVMAFEAGLLFVAANTGFLGGPSVLANMAVDNWMPRQFRQLSSRLVTQNGIFLFGLAALMILMWSHGSVSLLVVLYSINVFLTFSLSLYGLCVYWWRHRQTEKKWLQRWVLSALGFVVTATILLVTLVEKFEEGGWMTVMITGLVITLCLMIKRHYLFVRDKLEVVDETFASAIINEPCKQPPALDPTHRTAVLLVGKRKGAGIHTLLWVQRLFPNIFKNFVFISVGEVDSEKFGADSPLKRMSGELNDTLNYCVNFCHHNGLAAAAYSAYGTDEVEELVQLAEKLSQEYADCMFFASRLVFINDKWWSRYLHNQTAEALQRQLHLRGMQMVILPMKI